MILPKKFSNQGKGIAIHCGFKIFLNQTIIELFRREYNSHKNELSERLKIELAINILELIVNNET